MNLLFIGPRFYGYEKAIKNILDTRYKKVIFCDETPYHMSIYYNALRRISSQVSNKVLQSYNHYIQKIVFIYKIDIIFIIRGAFLSMSTLESIRIRYPHIKIINYQWDSIMNNYNGLMISRFADFNYSFDLADVSKYNEKFQYLPLFYSWDNIHHNRKNKQSVTDIFFLGSYHSKRHQIVKELGKQCNQQGVNFRSYIYIPPLVYYRKRILGEVGKYSDVNFIQMSRQDYYDSLVKAKVVLDIHSPTQTGATIRTIEALSLGRKIISTNQMLANEKFFSPNNIFFWDGLEKLDLNHIIASPFDHTRDKYIFSIDEWLKKMGV